jgi:hypothetical protein
MAALSLHAEMVDQNGWLEQEGLIGPANPWQRSADAEQRLPFGRAERNAVGLNEMLYSERNGLAAGDYRADER